MENISEKHKLLITRVLAGEATDSEKKELDAWLESAAHHRDIFSEYQRIWQTPPAKAPKVIINKPLAWEKINQKIDSQEQTAEKSQQKVIPLINKSKVWFYSLSGIAAMLILIAGVYFMLMQKPQTQLLSYENTEETTTDPFILSDGSTVFFNGKASLNYPAEFADNQRKVSLKGNAFFDVATFASYPFIIELDGARLVVPGTSFNIVQDTTNGNIELAVLSGKVILETATGQSITLHTDEMVNWQPGSQSLTREPVLNYNFMAWKTGKLEFMETALDQVFSDIQKAYHIEMMWPAEIASQKLTARFIDENPEDIFNTLEILFDITIEKQQNVYVVTN